MIDTDQFARLTTMIRFCLQRQKPASTECLEETAERYENQWPHCIGSQSLLAESAGCSYLNQGHYTEARSHSLNINSVMSATNLLAQPAAQYRSLHVSVHVLLNLLIYNIGYVSPWLQIESLVSWVPNLGLDWHD